MPLPRWRLKFRGKSLGSSSAPFAVLTDLWNSAERPARSGALTGGRRGAPGGHLGQC